MMIKVVIAGARGRMGTAAVKAIVDATDMKLVAILDYKNDGKYLSGTEINGDSNGVPIFTSISSMNRLIKPDVLLDLTEPDSVFKTVHEAISLGIRPVVGTSGLSEVNIKTLSELAKNKRLGGIIAPNFSIGAVLMMKFSAMAARYLGDIEIIELHHNKKMDAPSGTALKTAEMIKKVREPHIQGHPDEKEHYDGARGADIDGMKIHSVRLPGFLAHQEVLLGGEGEMLSIRHDSFDRSSFMPGILMSIRSVTTRNDLVYGLENIIE